MISSIFVLSAFGDRRGILAWTENLTLRWVGPASLTTEILEWDARDGGCWRYVARRGSEEFGFRGCFHTVREDRIVQTFTWEGQPEDVSLETLRVEDLGNGRTRPLAR